MQTGSQSRPFNESLRVQELSDKSGHAQNRQPWRSTMETSEMRIPTFVLEDRLFMRRLERNINEELERLNKLVAEQVELLQMRKELMAEVNAAVMLRWKNEVDAIPELECSTREEANQ